MQGLSRLNTSPFTRTDYFLAAFIFMLALGVRFVYYSVFKDEFWLLHPIVDSLNYDIWAREILNGNFLGEGPFRHSPLYPYFLALIYFFLGASVNSAIVWQFVLSAVSSILIFSIARKLFTRKVAFISGLLSCVYGPAIFLEANLLSTTLINFINLLLLVFLYLAIERKKNVYWFISGLLWGLGIITRPNIILFGFFLCLFAVFYQKKTCTNKFIFTSSFLLLLGALLTVSPSIIRNKMVLDEYMLTVNTGGINFYLGNHKLATGFHTYSVGELGYRVTNQSEVAKQIAETAANETLTYGEAGSYWYKRGVAEILESPSNWLQLAARKVLFFFNHYEYTTSLNYYLVKELAPLFNFFQFVNFILICPLALVGMAICLRSWKPLLPLYSLFIVYLVSNLIMLVSAEYRFGIMPVFFMFAAFTLNWLLDKQVVLKKRMTAFTAIVFLGIMVSWGIVPAHIRQTHLSMGYKNLAVGYSKLGDYGNAAKQYEKSLETSPTQVSLALKATDYAKMLFVSDDLEGALERIMQAYSITPDSKETMSVYATILTASGRYEKAIELRHELLGLEPDNVDFMIDLGISYLWAHRDREANAYFVRALEEAPERKPEISDTVLQILQKRN